MTATAKVCAHCGTGQVSRPRGLCWTCYYKPGVRENHPPTGKCGERGLAGGNFVPGQAAFPTDASPGSEAKVKILMIRARLRQDLWHPLDDRPMR
jgi:hypothetical protein